MDFEPDQEQRLIVETVRRFVQEEIAPLEGALDPDASELEAEDRARLVAKVKEMGFYGLDIPEEYGGPGIDIVTRTLMAIEMSQHRAGLYAPCYGVFGGAGLAQLYEADDAQKELYLYPTLRGEKRGFFGLTEPSGGSDPARAIRTTAERQGDDWILNGEKTFISGADKADFGLIFARTDPTLGREGISCFLIDTDMPGFHVRRVIHTLRSSHYATEIEIKDLRVPAANVLGEVNGGFAIATDRVSRQRIPYAAGCIGVGDQGSGDGDRLRQCSRDLRRRSRDTAGDSMDDRRQRDRHPHGALLCSCRRGPGESRAFVPYRSSDGEVDRDRGLGKSGGSSDADSRRLWHDQRSTLGALVAGAAYSSRRRGSERDPATDHRAQPPRPFTALTRGRRAGAGPKIPLMRPATLP